MIQSFSDELTEKIFNGVRDREVSKFPQDVLSTAKRKLDMIEYATVLQDLAVPPGNRLEKLIGDLEECYSIRINDQWRIVFKWQDDGAHEVRIWIITRRSTNGEVHTPSPDATRGDIV